MTAVQVLQGEQLSTVRNGYWWKITSLVVWQFYQKSVSKELSVHPSWRMSFNLAFFFFFCGKAPQAEVLGLLEEYLGRRVGSWLCLLYCSVLQCIIYLLPYGSAWQSPDTEPCVWTPDRRGNLDFLVIFHFLQAHLQMDFLTGKAQVLLLYLCDVVWLKS